MFGFEKEKVEMDHFSNNGSFLRWMQIVIWREIKIVGICRSAHGDAQSKRKQKQLKKKKRSVE